MIIPENPSGELYRRAKEITKSYTPKENMLINHQSPEIDYKKIASKKAKQEIDSSKNRNLAIIEELSSENNKKTSIDFYCLKQEDVGELKKKETKLKIEKIKKLQNK